MEAKTFNGWTNYETWCVALWLDQDGGTHFYFQERALQCWEHANAGSGLQDIGLSPTEDAIRELSQEIRGVIDDGQPEIRGLYADLLGSALSEVDWAEIATQYIDTVRSEQDSESDDDEKQAEAKAVDKSADGFETAVEAENTGDEESQIEREERF